MSNLKTKSTPTTTPRDRYEIQVQVVERKPVVLWQQGNRALVSNRP